ncbi:MAG: rRNA maturation RNase YbeY [Xanthomonadales bacterium]|nr:rRNA maturation RNase YbeY [Xanthomonadales bacterium]
MISLELINEENLKAPDSSDFVKWLDLVANHLNVEGEVCIKIIGQEESQYLNHTYRCKNKPTNVLSFPAEIPDFVESEHIGDLAICASVVEQEALEQNKPLNHHWAHMTIHGLLHLLGYDHIDDAEAEEMEAFEIQLLYEIGVKNPY